MTNTRIFHCLNLCIGFLRRDLCRLYISIVLTLTSDLSEEPTNSIGNFLNKSLILLLIVLIEGSSKTTVHIVLIGHRSNSFLLTVLHVRFVLFLTVLIIGCLKGFLSLLKLFLVLLTRNQIIKLNTDPLYYIKSRDRRNNLKDHIDN